MIWAQAVFSYSSFLHWASLLKILTNTEDGSWRAGKFEPYKASHKGDMNKKKKKKMVFLLVFATFPYRVACYSILVNLVMC